MKFDAFCCLSVYIFFFISPGISLVCYQCESSNDTSCQKLDKEAMEQLCDTGENVCLSLGVNNPFNEDRPKTYVRRCAKDQTICDKVKNIHKNDILECSTCGLDKCNKHNIG